MKPSAASSPSLPGHTVDTYDSLNRLATATAGATGTFNGANVSGKVQAWTYDAFGNRTTQTASNGAPFPTEWANYATTGNNHISTSNTGPNTGNVTYDLDGRLLSDGDRSYLWEAQGWLCGITAPGPAYYQYIYDAEGRRITSVTRANANCDLGYQSVWQDFVLDKDGNQVTEISGAGAWKHTNVYADGELLATYDPNGVHFAFGDWQGTKRAQASATGTLEVTCDNLPFNDGFACQGPGGSDATEHHYTGKEHDPYTGLDLFGARNFTNYSGRFLSPDWDSEPSPVPYAYLANPQTLNLYSYALNNPLSQRDDDGHASWQPCAGDPSSQCWTGDYNGEQNNGLYWNGQSNQWQQNNPNPPPSDSPSLWQQFTSWRQNFADNWNARIAANQKYALPDNQLDKDVYGTLVQAASLFSTLGGTDITSANSRFPNKNTGMTQAEFGQQLESQGFTKGQTSDGSVQYTRSGPNGKEEITLYPQRSSTGVPGGQVKENGLITGKLSFKP